MMDFIISNVRFPGLKSIDDTLFFKGEFLSFNENKRLYYEGYLVDKDIDNVFEYVRLGLDKVYANGAYFVICYNLITRKLEIKNDKRATIPFYIYRKGKHFAFSNNVWLLVQLFYDQISIDFESLKAQLTCFNDFHSTRTLFTNIERIDGASYYFFSIEEGLKKSNYWNFKYQPKTDFNLVRTLEKCDDDFRFYFKKIHQLNGDAIMGFGNSGGFDSRLIAYYASQERLPFKAFVFGDKKPNIVLESTTSLLSKKVGKCFDFTTVFINYRTDYLLNQFLLDIRNAPFIYSQLFINPYQDVGFYDYMISGDPGGIMYLPEKVLSNNVDQLKDHANYFIGTRRWSITGWRAMIRKSLGHLNIKYDETIDQGVLGLGNSMIDKIINKFDKKSLNEEMNSCIDSMGGDNNVEKWIRCHDKITTKYQYRSGYDSISGIKRNYFLYYPFYYDMVSELPLDYFKDRKMLKELISYIGNGLDLIPGQNMQLVTNTNHSKSFLYMKKIEMAMRGRGLSFYDLLKSEDYKIVAMEILLRDNPVFYEIVDRIKFINSGFWKTYVGMNFVKIKLLLDVFYYKEFELLENKKFEFAKWY